MAKKQDLLDIALQSTRANIVKGRGTSGRKTYLDRFVDTLLDENGEPTEPKERVQVVAEISLAICQEQRAADQQENPDLPDFTLTAARDTEDDAMFAEVNNKVKNQVAAAIANNQNATSLSYNEKYKHTWEVVKDGSKVSLARVSAE